VNLVDLLAEGDRPSTPFVTAKVVAVAAGSVTVWYRGGTVSGVRYVGVKPAVNSRVLLGFVEDQPVSLGTFGTS
jgi:hypothetical protein